jgi:hypothetical protein
MMRASLSYWNVCTTYGKRNPNTGTLDDNVGRTEEVEEEDSEMDKNIEVVEHCSDKGDLLKL